jgi:hypothetical protein
VRIASILMSYDPRQGDHNHGAILIANVGAGCCFVAEGDRLFEVAFVLTYLDPSNA